MSVHPRIVWLLRLVAGLVLVSGAAVLTIGTAAAKSGAQPAACGPANGKVQPVQGLAATVGIADALATVTLQWSYPANPSPAPVGFDIVGTGGGRTFQAEVPDAGDGTTNFSFVDQYADPNVAYSYSVVAAGTGDYCSPPSTTTATITTRYPTYTGFSFTTTSSRLNFSWTRPPASTNGATFVGGILRQGTVAGPPSLDSGEPVGKVIPATATGANINLPLKPGASYSLFTQYQVTDPFGNVETVSTVADTLADTTVFGTPTPSPTNGCQTNTCGKVGGAAPSTTPTSTNPAGSRTPVLASTASTRAAPDVELGITLIIAGATLLWFTRRRRPHPSHARP